MQRKYANKLRKKKVQAKPKNVFKLHGTPLMFRSTILLKKAGEDEVVNDSVDEVNKNIDKGEEEEHGDHDEQRLHPTGFGIRSESIASQD